MSECTLKITEIFYSLQGEADSVGWPTVFIRLTGCPLRCRYCDTAYAFSGGERMTVADILARVSDYNVRHVCVTGGEPLAQKDCNELLRRLCDAGYQVSLETSGAMDISVVDSRVARVVDIKTPGSGEQHRNRWQNLDSVTSCDRIKFVICDRQDYQWSKDQLYRLRLHERCDVFFSPGAPTQPAAELADWILADQLPVRFQLQLHKVLWGDVPGK